MDFVSRKLRSLKNHRSKSRFRSKVVPEDGSDLSRSRFTSSTAIIDKVILSRPLLVNFEDELNVADFRDSEFVKDLIKWHNIYRDLHGVPPLKLSNPLCALAQSWTNHLAHHNTFYHRNLKDIGESLFSRWSIDADFDISGEQLSKYWYEESKQYNFNQEPSTLHVNAGHFSQMVWRSSIEIGIGKAKTRCGKMFVVVNYKPAGNVIGEFQNNIFPTEKTSEKSDEIEGMLI